MKERKFLLIFTHLTGKLLERVKFSALSVNVLLVDLVGQYEQSPLIAPSNYALDVLSTQHLTGRISGIYDADCARLAASQRLTVRSLQLINIQRPIVIFIQIVSNLYIYFFKYSLMLYFEIY